MNKYEYPVDELQQAFAVTAPDFDPDLVKNSQLYQDFSKVRSEDYRKRIFRLLGIEQGELPAPIPNYHKIIFSGHRGCGKSVELQRMHAALNTPQAYFSVLMEMEKTADLFSLEHGDFLFLLFVELAAQLSERETENQPVIESLRSLADKLFSEQEVKEELRDSFSLEVETTGEAGIHLFFAQLKAKFNSVFSSENVTSKTIRRKLRTNPMMIIEGFNACLRQIRTQLLGEDTRLGKDIVIIIDGSEKADRSFYEQLFHNAHLLHSIECTLVFSVPIHSYYSIGTSPTHKFEHCFVLPMLSPDEDTGKLLESALAKRLDIDHFFDPALIPTIAQKSGGCVRQFFRIVNKCLIEAESKADSSVLDKVLKEMGLSMYRTLSSEHHAVLESGSFNPSDPEILELLFALALLEYNGERKVNPILADYMAAQKAKQ